MQPMVKEANSHIKNLVHLVEVIDIVANEDEILTSLNIITLYPIIPIDEALHNIIMIEGLWPY